MCGSQHEYSKRSDQSRPAYGAVGTHFVLQFQSWKVDSNFHRLLVEEVYQGGTEHPAPNCVVIKHLECTWKLPEIKPKCLFAVLDFGVCKKVRSWHFAIFRVGANHAG